MSHGWRWYLGVCIGFVDSLALTVLLWIETAAAEWLSVSQRSIEKSMIFGYGVTYIWQVYIWPWSWARPIFYLWLGFIYVGMRSEVSRTKNGRLAKRIDIAWIVQRFALMVYTVATFGIDWYKSDHGVSHYGWSGDWSVAIYTLFHYSTSLPSLGTPGSKRKVASEWLRSTFGGSWMPEPEGSGA